MKNKLLLQKTNALLIFLFSSTLSLHGQHLAPALTDNDINPTIPSVASSSSQTLIDCNRQAIIDDYNDNYLGSEFNIAEINWTGDVATCDPGTINNSVNEKILQRINYFRRLAQVTDDIQLNPVKNGKAQETVLMFEANAGFSHCDGVNNAPCDSWDCNTLNAIQGAQSSNIAANNWNYANPIDMYIEDAGSNNVAVGHRRWILFSRGNEMGNGISPSKHALWVIGDYAPTPTYNNFIAYPSPGFFPRSLVFPRWSFGIPGANFANATVSMTKDGEAMATYITSSTTNFADPTLVWLAGGSTTFTSDADVEFEVTIDGITGAPQSSYTYTVLAIKEEMPSFSYETLDSYCEDNGMATANFSAGAQSYQWTPGGNTTQTIIDLAPGIYNLTVTDINDCEAIDSVSITNDTITTPHPGDGMPGTLQSISGQGNLMISTTGTELKTDEATGWWITKSNPIYANITSQASLDTAIVYANIQPYNNGFAINTSPSILFLDDSIQNGIAYDCSLMDDMETYYATPFVTSYRPTIPDTSCTAENGAVGNLFISGQPGKFTSINPTDIDCRPDSLLNLPNYSLDVTVTNYTGPVGELAIWIQDNSFSGNTILYSPFLSGNGTYTFTQNSFSGYNPNDPGDPSWTTGLTVLSWHMFGNGMQNGNIELSLNITYPGDPGIPFPSMTYSSCIFGEPVLFACSSCSSPSNIPTVVGNHHATNECTDAAGWTHYWDNVDGTSGNADDLFLLSIKKDGNDIGTVGDGTFDLFINVGNNNAGDAVHIPATVPYVTNPEGWHIMDRYWQVAPTSQPTSPVAVRFYYTNDDFNDVANAPEVELLGHENLSFYKTIDPADPNPGTGHNNITSTQVIFYDSEGTDWLYTGDVTNNYHTAELLVVNEFSGGGAGASDCEGCGPLPVEFLSFTGQLRNDEILLEWETASEENNDYFKLEKSVDGIRFDLLSTIPGAGNSNQTQQYSYIDEEPFIGTNYYRLSQIDYDGSSHFSGNLVAVNYRKEGQLSFYPNPASNEINIRIESSFQKSVSYELYDAVGRLVHQGEFEAPHSQEELTLDVNRFNEGLYLLRLINGMNHHTFYFLKK